MPQSISILIAIFLTIWVGLPVATALRFGGESRRDHLLLHAFVGGLLVIGLVSQSFWKLGWNAHQAAWPFLGAVSVVNACLLFRTRRHPRSPIHPQYAGIGAIVVSALFLLSVYAVNRNQPYYGRAWGDQVNYSFVANVIQHGSPTLAQPLYTKPAEAAARVHLKDRIGQAALHSWIGEWTASPALESFYGVCVLGTLAFCATLYLVGQALGLPANLAAVAASAAAASPPYTAILLESFLSQVLVTPFVFYTVLVSHHYALSGRRPWLVLTAACAAWILTAYSEFFPVLLVAGGVLLIALFGTAPQHRRRYLYLILGVEAGMLLACWLSANPIGLTLRGGMSLPGFENFFPWAYTREGFARLWVGDWATSLPSGALLALASLALGLMASTITQLLLLLYRRASALASALAALLVLPFAVMLLPNDHSYQFYKLLQSVWPAALLGMVPLAANFAPGTRDRSIWLRGALLGLIVLTLGGSSWHMLTVEALGQSPRSGIAPYLRQHGQQTIDRLVDGRPEKQIIISMPNRVEWKDSLKNGVVALQLSPHFSAIQAKWIYVGEHPHRQPVSPIVPADPAAPTIRSIQPEFRDHLGETLVLQIGARFLKPAPGLMKEIGSAGELTLFRPTSNAWLIASSITGPDPMLSVDGHAIVVGDRPEEFIQLGLESANDLPDGVGLEVEFTAPESASHLRWHLYSNMGYGTHAGAAHHVLRVNTGALRRGVTNLYFGLAPEQSVDSPPSPSRVKITRITYGL